MSGSLKAEPLLLSWNHMRQEVGSTCTQPLIWKCLAKCKMTPHKLNIVAGRHELSSYARTQCEGMDTVVTELKARSWQYFLIYQRHTFMYFLVISGKCIRKNLIDILFSESLLTLCSKNNFPLSAISLPWLVFKCELPLWYCPWLPYPNFDICCTTLNIILTVRSSLI